MQDWYPEAIIDKGNDAGPYTDNGEPKGCFHTTEGKSYQGARGAYVENNSWPHATATYEDNVFKIFQHNPISVASRALKNLGGGVETNRDRIVQLELVGTADTAKKNWGDQYVENFPEPYLDGVKRFMEWVEAQLNVPQICHVQFKSYPSSYGANGVRLSSAKFDAYTGWLGHQHVPENTHGDPGLLDIDYLLYEPAPNIPQEDDDMAWIMAATGKVTRLVMGDSKASQVRDAVTINSFKAAGQFRQVSPGDYDSIMKGLAAPELVRDDSD